jgi:predicted RNA-binding protein with PUA-like domain
MNYWLVKQEPSAYSWNDFVRDGATAWTGVRNFQARNNLRSMKLGDRVLFYHSVSDKAVVGEADWVCVDLKPVRALPAPVSLERIRAENKLAELPLRRSPRLSVMRVSPQEYETILDLSKD